MPLTHTDPETTSPEDAIAAYLDRRASQLAGRATYRPSVSIIIPAYNVAQYIGESLQSVFTQTVTDFEVIVVNDGSPDTEDMERVLAPFMPYIRYLVQGNRGPSSARNTGLRAARADIVALLDSDDMWEPEYLEMQLARVHADPSISVLYCDAFLFGDGVAAGRRFMDRSPSKGPVTVQSLVSQQCNVMVSVMGRRDAFLDAGMFDETLRSSEDFDMWLRILQAGGKIEYHHAPLVRYRIRPDSLSADVLWMHDHVIEVLDRALKRSPSAGGEAAAVEKAVRRFRASRELLEGKRALLLGDAAASERYFANAYHDQASAKLLIARLMLRVAPRWLSRIVQSRDAHLLQAGRRRLQAAGGAEGAPGAV